MGIIDFEHSSREFRKGGSRRLPVNNGLNLEHKSYIDQTGMNAIRNHLYIISHDRRERKPFRREQIRQKVGEN